jgi:Tfp pilus assembly pilus retraction ATPase PilT
MKNAQRSNQENVNIFLIANQEYFHAFPTLHTTVQVQSLKMKVYTFPKDKSLKKLIKDSLHGVASQAISHKQIASRMFCAVK